MLTKYFIITLSGGLDWIDWLRRKGVVDVRRTFGTLMVNGVAVKIKRRTIA